MMTAEQRAVVDYKKRRLYVFPVKPDKTPLVPWKEPVTLEQVQQWWSQWPTALIGMACGPSGVVAIDVDVKNGVDGWAALDALMLDLGPLPGTRTSETPSGGVHMLYRAPEGFEIGPSASKLGRGIDVRAGWSYVILPPSKAEHGEYTWLVDQQMTELPEAWAKRLQKPKPRPVQTPRPLWIPSRKANVYGVSLLNGAAEDTAKAEPGTRNDTVTRKAFRVGTYADACGISFGQAAEMFRWAASQWGDPAEARKAADSFERAFQAGREHPRRPEIQP